MQKDGVSLALDRACDAGRYEVRKSGEGKRWKTDEERRDESKRRMAL